MYNTINQVLDWIKIQNQQVTVKIEEIPLAEITGWKVDFDSGIICHDTGKFFSIEGISVCVNNDKNWEQPIINQPEYGILGFLVKIVDGEMYFCMQAKVEPGNLNYIQLSPTLQATKSNYTQVHKGKKPTYLEYFIDVDPARIVYDGLQSEQGSRFYKKRNRNMIILIDDEVPVYDNFAWVSLPVLKELMHRNNVVNMDTRTVISCLSPELYSRLTNATKQSVVSSAGVYTYSFILSYLTNARTINEVKLTHKSLATLQNWHCDNQEIYHKYRRFFSIIGVSIEVNTREVTGWCQPMLKPANEGICALIMKKINGIEHFVMQVMLECGSFDIAEYGPTVQCLDDDYKLVDDKDYPFLDYVLNSANKKVMYDALLSEEGGRFYMDQNRYMIVEADDSFPLELPSGFIWISGNQIHSLIRYSNYFNIQARSLISVLPFSVFNG